MTCAKQTVTATLVAIDGTSFVATNHCLNPQKTCPRGDLPTGVGYELCTSICQQVGHAEENVLILAGEKAKGATVIIEGHTYACSSCESVMKQAGVSKVIFERML